MWFHRQTWRVDGYGPDGGSRSSTHVAAASWGGARRFLASACRSGYGGGARGRGADGPRGRGAAAAWRGCGTRR
eukprot:3265456-Pyramimonas_sp.AAC.1